MIKIFTSTELLINYCLTSYSLDSFENLMKLLSTDFKYINLENLVKINEFAKLPVIYVTKWNNNELIRNNESNLFK